MTPIAHKNRPTEGVLVWDLPLRLVHWALLVCFVGSWLTAELGFDWTQTHFRFGYATLGLVSFRVVWGFVGPTHARFAQFVKGPRAVWHHMRQLPQANSTSSIGHNPLGALAVVALLLALLMQAGTGLFISDDIFYAGPYNPAVSADTASFLAKIHHWNFRWLQLLVALHVLAIAWYYFRQGDNLVLPMLNGRKPIGQSSSGQGINHSRVLVALIVALLVALSVWWLLSNAPVPQYEDFS